MIKEKSVSEVAEQLNDIYKGKKEGSKPVDDLIKSGDHKEAIQLIDVVSNEVAKMTVTSDEDIKVVNNVKKTMLEDLGKVSNSFSFKNIPWVT